MMVIIHMDDDVNADMEPAGTPGASALEVSTKHRIGDL